MSQKPVSPSVAPTGACLTFLRQSSLVSAVYGYLRVSGTDQVLDLQRDALAKAGCDRVWEEVASGAKNDRPELIDLLDHLRPGDTLIVWRLDRLGRSLTHLIETVEDLQSRGVSFKSLTETIDTSSPGGMLVFQIFGALAQFERALIQERTVAGLAAARARGRIGGQPKRIDAAKARQIQRMIEDGTPKSEIAAVLGIGRATLYRHLAAPSS
ncbi:DNA invertase Pin-like site-specific DNA recombinase [Rhodococcus sp. OAS809]